MMIIVLFMLFMLFLRLYETWVKSGYMYIPDLLVTSIAVTYPICLRPIPPYHDDTHELQELVMKTVALKTLNLVIHLRTYTTCTYLFRCLMGNKGNGEHGHRGAIGRSTWQTTTARASWMPW